MRRLTLLAACAGSALALPLLASAGQPPLAPARSLTRAVASPALVMLGDAAPGRIATTRTEPAIRIRLSQYVGGTKPDCVGCGWTGLLDLAPAPLYNLHEDFAIALWRWTRDHDMWPGNDGDEDAGTDPAIAARWLRGQGYLAGLPREITTEREARVAVLTQGPLGFSTPWFEGMTTPDARGVIRRTGAWVGDHFWIALWFNQATGRWVFLNSWAGWPPYDKFGQRVEMPASDVRRLFALGATAFVPVKAKRR
jgi:hypothetical protein